MIFIHVNKETFGVYRNVAQGLKIFDDIVSHLANGDNLYDMSKS
jgi:hypothetical protein